jgi:hypothetical protein
MTLEAKAKAWTLKAKAKDDFLGQGLDLQGQGQKKWPPGPSRPRPGLEDYITVNECHLSPVPDNLTTDNTTDLRRP